jgi:outer membrane receptor protein involved in Fe transport
VVVTAEKRSVNIQQVPASVSAIKGDKLLDLGLKSLDDYSKYVPGLLIQSGGTPGQTNITLRGVAPFGPGATVGTYINDTPLGSSNNWARATIFALDLMPYDVDRVEVLRGPQGTLYGAGSMGGLLKYVFKEADPGRYTAQAGAEVESVKNSGKLGYGVRAAINAPIVEDKLAFRASFYDQERQGYTDNVARNQQGIDDGRQYGARFAVTFRPNEAVRINLNAMYAGTDFDDSAFVRLDNPVAHSDPGGAVFYTGTPVLGDLSQSFFNPNTFNKKTVYYAGTLNWDLNWATFTSATSWSHETTDQSQDATDTYGAYTQLFGLAPGKGRFDLALDMKKFTQEFRLASPSGGKVEWLLGAFYTSEDVDNQQFAYVNDENNRPITTPGVAPYFNPIFAYAQVPSVYKEYAVFGDVTWNLSSKFDVTGGIRYAHNKQDFSQISDGLILGGYKNQPGNSAEGVVTWQANARYHFTDDVMAYARVATGYRAGGPNVVILNSKPSVKSDKLISYEAGVKSTFWDGRALLNVTAFDIQWSGMQIGVSNPACGCSYLDNGGDAYSRGLEIEGNLVPVAGLTLGYNLTYTKAQLTSNIPGAPPFILNTYQLPDVPKWTGAVTADYNWPLNGDWTASFGGGIHFVGEEISGPVTDPIYSPNAKNPSYATGDLHAGIDNGKLNIGVFVHNVTDERVYLNQALQTDPLHVHPDGSPIVQFLYAVPIQPRTIGISIDAKF